MFRVPGPRAALAAGALAAAALCLTLPEAGQAQDPTINFAANDAAMNAAIDKARESLPGFLDRARIADLGDSGWLVKWARPIDGDGREHIWVALTSVQGDDLAGYLANDPVDFEGRAGDPVAFPASEVSDWSSWSADGKLEGNYTTRVMLPDLSPEQRAQLTSILAPLPGEN